MRRVCLIVLSTLLALATERATANDLLPVELRPYDVTLAIHFVRGPEFPPAFRDRVIDESRSLIRRTLGERWRLAVQEAPAGIETPPAENAKRIDVIVESQGPGFRVTAREADGLTGTRGAEHSIAVSQRVELSRRIAEAAQRAFRPLALIDTSNDNTAHLAFQAEAIPAPDPSAEGIAEGTLFTPFLRKFDREGALVEVRKVPFSLLQVARVEHGTAEVTVLSALRSPLGGRRGTVEGWAIAAPASRETTRLTVVRQDDGVPLAGRIVEVRDRPFQPGEDEPPATASLLTDRSGSVVLAARASGAIDWLTIKSGNAVLMRLPVAPGVEPHITLPLADDQRRLEAEGRLAILTGELIELVARRATLLASARNNARAADYKLADEAIAAAEKLPDAAAFRRRIAAVEAPAAKAAEDAGDRLSAARIHALGRKATGLVDRYLNPDALRATVEEVEELKRTDPNRK